MRCDESRNGGRRHDDPGAVERWLQRGRYMGVPQPPAGERRLVVVRGSALSGQYFSFTLFSEPW